MRIRTVGLALLGAALATAGCAIGPDYRRPELETPVPASWGRTAAESAPDSSLVPWRWWEAFGDTTLNGLITDALTHNLDLERAVARVLEAGASVKGATSARWPTVEVGGSAARSKGSERVILFGPLLSNAYAATATARWELDLWGRLARGHEAAVATLLAGEQNRRAVAQSLIAGVVRSWLVIQETQLQVALTRRTIGNFERSLTLVRDRYRRGLVGPLDVHLASQNLAAARARLPGFQQQLVEAKRTLEILCGRYPGATITASDDEAPDGTLARDGLPAPLGAVPAGLPSDLLDRRPDLLAAEAELGAAVARIGQVKAALYPRIGLTAEGGSRSRELGDLLQAGSDAWSLVANLVMPLINRGATTSQIAAAEARARGAVAAYRAAVLRAFAEVENALDRDVHQAEQERHLIVSAESSRSAVALAEDRYRRGLDNLLTTLESQRRLFEAESSLLTVQRQRRAARVDLILALGGPWEVDSSIPQGARP